MITRERPSLPQHRDFGWRGRIGLILPANNTVLEPEVYGALEPGLTAHFARIPTESMALEAYTAMLGWVDRAADDLATARVDVIAYACLSTSLTQPAGWDERIAAELGTRANRPVVTAAQAVVEGLRARGLTSVAVVSPYPPHIDRLVADYFSRRGITVVSSATLSIADIHEVGNVDPAEVYALARQVMTEKAEAVLILATDLRTHDIVDALEADLAVPVVSTNRMLVEAGVARLRAAREARRPVAVLEGERP